MKNRLMRPSAALFPLALLANALFGRENISGLLLVCWLFLNLTSLCAVDGFRNAAAREPGPRKADRRFWGSFPMLILALGLSLYGAIGFSGSDYALLMAAASAWLVLIEHLFEERLFTLNRRSDGNLLSLISNGLLFAGMMLDGMGGLPKPFEVFYTLIAAGLGAVIAVLTSLVIAPPKGFSLLPRNLLFAPKAMVQTLLYPAAIFTLAQFLSGSDNSGFGFFAGFALWRLSRTVCRRSNDESRPLNLLLIAVCAVSVAVLPLNISFCCLTALICAMIVFLHPGWRNLAGTILLIAGFACVYLKIAYADYIAIACGLIAIAINLKNAFLKKI